MVDVIKHHKVVAALPSIVEADSVYYVRVGTGFDAYVTNSLGIPTAYKINGLSNPVVKETSITEESYALPLIKANATMVMENVWKPTSNALSVVANTFIHTVGDTTTASMVGSSHQVSLFHYAVTKGGRSQATIYGQEFRVKQEDNSTLNEFIATKHVIEPTSSNSGTLGAYILEQFDNMSGAITHVTSFQRQFLDPRIVTYHAGGEIRLPQVLTASYTVKDSDSGKDFFVVSATDVTITVPTTLTDGWRGRFFQAQAGKALFNFSGMTVVEPDGLLATQGLGHSASVSAAPSSNIAMLGLTKVVATTPVVFNPGARSGRTYGAIGRHTLQAPQDSALNASGLFPVPIAIAKRTTIGTIGLRLGTAASGQNLKFSIFRPSTTGLLGAKLYESANVSLATTGDKQVTTVNTVLEPGLYFFCVVASTNAMVQWAGNLSLAEMFGRPSSTGLETYPVYAVTYAATLPADMSSVAPTTYIDSFGFAPDLYWRI